MNAQQQEIDAVNHYESLLNARIDALNGKVEALHHERLELHKL